MPSMSPSMRCALTAPFHPCVRKCRMMNAEVRMKRGVFCLVFILHSAFKLLHFLPRFLSVALSVGLLRLDVIKHRALCSSDFPHHGLPRGATASSAAMQGLYTILSPRWYNAVDESDFHQSRDYAWHALLRRDPGAREKAFRLPGTNSSAG